MNKTVCYKISEKSHIDLKARLQYDGIPIAHFMKHIIKCYLEKDDSMLEIVDKYKERKKILNKKGRQSARKRIDKGRRVAETFNLNNKEVEEVYDILENNMGGYEDL